MPEQEIDLEALAGVLTGPRARMVRFGAEAHEVGPEGFGKVAEMIGAGHLGLRIDPAIPRGAVYDPVSGEIVLADALVFADLPGAAALIGAAAEAALHMAEVNDAATRRVAGRMAETFYHIASGGPLGARRRN